MEFLELFILSVAVGLYDCCDEELLKRNAVFCKIIYKKLLDGFRENGKIFVNLKNIDSVRLHHLRDVGLNSRHKEGTEEAYELLLTKEVFCSYQFEKQFSCIVSAEGHFSRCTDRNRESICRLNVLYLGIRSPFDRHLLGLVDEINLAMEGAYITGCAIQRLADQRNVLCFKCITTCTEQVKCLSIHEEDRFLTLVNDKLS